jgi:hypothetical protein
MPEGGIMVRRSDDVTRWPTKLLVAALFALAMSVLGSSTAEAGSPVTEFFVKPSTTQAGGHPDIRTVFVVENHDQQADQLPPGDCQCEDPKDVSVHLPAGVIGVPDSMPKCTDAEFGSTACSPDSQIGLLQVGVGSEPFEGPEAPFLGKIGVYNLVPHPGQAALFGANVSLINAPIYFVFTPRTGGDYGLDERTVNIAHPVVAVHWADLVIWGVPADPSHQEDRHPKGCNTFTGERCHPGAVATVPLRPFTLNPTSCGEQLTASIDVVAYDRGVTHASAPYPSTTGCDQLSFNPSLFAEPTATATDTASGAEIDLRVPQDLSPSAPSASEIRNTQITFPEGFSINANGADGKEACTDAQARFGTEAEAQCPEAAKIGSLTISTATLPGPLHGFLYLGEPKAGERYRLVLVADGFNVHVKLPGTAIPDPDTGQLTVVFKDLPQFPFSDFNLHLFGAERGSLATPTRCGTYPVNSSFTPWDSLLTDQASVQFFNISSGPEGSPCPSGARPFAPSFEGGVTNRTAGKHVPFVLRLTRADGHQNLSGLDLKLPPGLAAKLKGIPYCPASALANLASSSYSGLAEIANPSCPAASLLGSVVAGAGSGSRPVHVTGKAYLAGPYKGAPLSVVVVIPAVSGPYDLGNIAVRSALYVDPVTAQVTAKSDPFPQIVGGIPLRARSVQFNLDRSDFIVNPTNCDPLSVGATIFGNEGGNRNTSTHFQVANCSDLAYHPTLRLQLSGGLARRGHPAIHAELSTGTDEANTRRVQVTLPKGELLDNAHIETICTRVQFAAGNCPGGSRIGHAEAISPLLDQPLSGSVYLRASSHPLPDMVVDLRGQFHIEASAKIETVHGRLRTTFESVPDVPVAKFTLDLLGGAKGLLQNTEGLCGAKKSATVDMLGQNGRRSRSNAPFNPTCGAGKTKRHRRHSGARRTG